MNKLKHIKKFIFFIFSSESFQQIVHVFFAIILPTEIVIKTHDDKLNLKDLFTFQDQTSFWRLFLVYMSLVAVFTICNKYRKKQNNYSKMDNYVQSELTSGISSLINYIKSRNEDRLFDAISQIVCNSLYHLLSDLYSDREVRISIVAQIENYGLKYYMSGYKSKNRSACDSTVHSLKGCNKYIKSILESNTENYVIFNNKEVKEKLVFDKSKAMEKQPREYIGIPYMGSYEKMCFVIQIDFTKYKSCGKNKEEIRRFINKYIWPFAELLAFGYTVDSFLSRSKGGFVNGKQKATINTRSGA